MPERAADVAADEEEEAEKYNDDDDVLDELELKAVKGPAAAAGAPTPTEECDDCSLAWPVPVRLASEDTFDPSGMLLGTLKRVQSLT